MTLPDDETELARWPAYVYGQGEEPDYRFSFANERTFLAWIRTSLALLAAAVVLEVADLSLPEGTRRALALVVVSLGVACAAIAWPRWARAERAMRRAAPLPGSGFSAALAIALVAAGAVVAAVLLRG